MEIGRGMFKHRDEFFLVQKMRTFLVEIVNTGLVVGGKEANQGTVLADHPGQSTMKTLANDQHTQRHTSSDMTMAQA